MDREKVIKGLKICTTYSSIEYCVKEGCPYLGGSDTGCCIDGILKDALELLKAQEPMKPKVVDAWPEPLNICANCGSCLITTESYKAKYCVECGQAVKWDG